MENDFEIIIVGAGASGLMAAAELSAAGKKVLVLEARSRIGGRIHTIKENGLFLEAGAEFIHGDLPVTLGLLKEANIKYHKTKGNMHRSKNGKWVEDEFINWDVLLNKMRSLKNDLPLSIFLEKYFSGKKNSEVRSSVILFAQGFDLVDIHKASTKELYKEWKNEDHNQYRLKNGYGEMIDFLENKCKENCCIISKDKIVSKVEWKKDYVKVFSNDKQVYTANKLLITIPASLMQHKNLAGAIKFKPAINKIKKDFQQIGFGSVIKILLVFKNAFWQNDKKKTSFILSDQKVPTWWTQLPEKKNVLTAWLGGPSAIKLSTAKDEKILKLALHSLSVIFNLPVNDLRDQLNASHIFKWHSEKFSNGAYTYPLPGSKKAIKKLNKPVAKTLFFAGEAMYTGNAPGTVEAALVSGKKTASRILKIFKE